MVTSGSKARHVANDTATQSNDGAIPGETVRHQDVEDPRDRRESLVRLPVRENGFDNAFARKAACQPIEVQRRDDRVAHDQNVARGNVLCEEIRAAQQPVPDQDGIAAVAELHSEELVVTLSVGSVH